MRLLAAFGSFALLLSTPCLAQRHGSGGTGFVGTGGYGNVAFPGTGGPNASFASRLGATVAGRPVYTRNPGRSGGYGGGYGGGGYVGAYPLYVGGSYIPSFAPDYSGQTQLAPQQQYAPPAPPVVINQYFTNPDPPPASTFYQPSADRPIADREEPAAVSQYYLLAFKDHSVYSASAYWIEDKTLHYVTPQHTHNQASLDLVDLAFTKQLNRDKDVPFSAQP